MNLKQLGDTLKVRREEQNLTLKQISNMTRIHVRYLQAIESGDFARLPGHPYGKFFVQQYARAIGLGVDETAAALDTAVGETTGRRRRRRHRERRRSRPKSRFATVRGIFQWIGVALFLIAFWYLIAMILGYR